MTALGALEPAELAPIAAMIRDAGISVLALAATDLYLMGRGDTRNVRRGLAPVRRLAEAGVNVAVSTNNAQNPVAPCGDADLLRTAVEVESGLAAFIEEETVPADARGLRQTWKKANKDGSPDRRLANSYQIPVVEYGRLTITSSGGLNEEYMLSSFPAVTQFTSVWKSFRQVVAGATA